MKYSKIMNRISLAALVVVISVPAYGQETSLKQAFKDSFVVGAALSKDQVTGKLPAAAKLAAEQFNSITPENLLKWQNVHPRPDEYDFGPADKYVEFGEKHDMFIVGHALVWHNQTPRWVFQDEDRKPLTRDALLERMREHIYAVVGRYKGRIHAWDVVNEAIETERGDDSKGKWRKTRWRQIIGPDYIEKAFQFAHEADPNAELYYNDYDEWKLGKRQYFGEIVNSLKSKGIRIDGIGLQGHWGLDYPSPEEIDSMLTDLSKLGVKLMITELDLAVLPPVTRNTGADVNLRIRENPKFNPYPEGLPSEKVQEQTDRYAEIFRLFIKHRDAIDRVTFWGVDDGQSWLNDWPVRGRTNYPLVFDRQYQPKPAYDAIIKEATAQ
jgi:endo-1,4-beta-xylanase